MEIIRMVVLAMLALALLAGCSDSDGGGTVGGKGTLDCWEVAGVYDLNPGTMKLNASCEFILNVQGNEARGEYRFDPKGGYFEADILLTKGPDRGQCGTLAATVRNGLITNVGVYDMRYCN